VEQSRYGKYQRTKVRRHRRSQYIAGAFEDRGKWYKCWNCGFVFDITKANGNPQNNGTYQIAQTIPAQSPTFSGDPLGVVSSLDRICMLGSAIGMTALEEEAGELSDLYDVDIYLGQAAAGCPFCGCTNQP
jgi:hypothetical protein